MMLDREKLKKIKSDMKRLPELIGFAENAKTPETKIMIKAKMLDELNDIKSQIVNL